MRLVKLFSILLMLVILTSTVQAYSISGNIKDDTANRLPGVTISSNSFTDVVQSDANGHFVMSRDYPIGTYEFTASKVGYTIELIQVRVVGYDVTNADSILTKVTSVPTSTTLTATSITSTSATLRGEVNPNGLSTTIDFASSTSFGQPGYFASTASQNIGSGSYIVSVSASLTDLIPNTVYSYAVRASNSKGFKNGAIVSFTTLPVADNGILKIKSNVNAKAYVDNVLAGNTNFNDYLTYLTTAGTHTVTISQTGYITWSSSVNVKSDKSSNPYTYIDANLISNDPTLPQTTLPKDPLKPMTIVTPTQPDAGDGPALDLCAIFGLFCPQTPASPIPDDSTPDGGWNWGGFNFPDFSGLFDFNFPDFGCMFGFGCNEPAPAGNEPVPAENNPVPENNNWWNIDWGCLFGCNPAVEQGTTGNKLPSSGTIVGGNTSSTSTSSPYSWMWLIILIAIISYTYINRKKLFKPTKKRSRR